MTGPQDRDASGLPLQPAVGGGLPDELPGGLPDELPGVEAITRDDEIIRALAAGAPVDDEPVANLLAAWRFDLERPPSLLLESAHRPLGVVRVGAHHPRRGGRLAVAVTAGVVLMAGGTAAASTAQPGSPLWPVTKVVAGQRAHSLQAHADVRAHLDNAERDMARGDLTAAAHHLEQARIRLAEVRSTDGADDLDTRLTSLADRLARLALAATTRPAGSGDAKDADSAGTGAAGRPGQHARASGDAASRGQRSTPPGRAHPATPARPGHAPSVPGRGPGSTTAGQGNAAGHRPDAGTTGRGTSAGRGDTADDSVEAGGGTGGTGGPDGVGDDNGTSGDGGGAGAPGGSRDSVDGAGTVGPAAGPAAGDTAGDTAGNTAGNTAGDTGNDSEDGRSGRGTAGVSGAGTPAHRVARPAASHRTRPHG